MICEPPTPRIARVVRVRRRAGAAVATLACAALITACGSSSSSSSGKTNLNTTRVAASIEQSILAQRHLKSKVVCPAAVPQEKGKTFECLATTRTTKPPVKVGKTTFVVTVQNDKGYVTYAGK
jgi:hypothetical protein